MSLIRIDDHRGLIPEGPAWLITPVRNELAILPDFLRHYRSLGIKDFCFIDNVSNDGTREFLLSQPDCLLFYTDESYRESNYAVDWINYVIAAIPISGWLVIADADEHLAYRDMETQPVGAFLKAREAEGADTLYAIMLDMYPEDEFRGMKIPSSARLGEMMPFFDSDYVFRRWPTRPGKPKGGLQIIGGPRCRLLSSLEREARYDWKFYTLANQVDRVIDKVPQSLLPYIAKIWPQEVPAQVKSPINYVRGGFRFINSHAAPNSRPSRESVALLHYKFCAELWSRICMARAEGNHYRRGLSYVQLERAIARWPQTSLLYPGSRRFRHSSDLLEVGLVGDAASIVWRSGFKAQFRSGASTAPAEKIASEMPG